MEASEAKSVPDMKISQRIVFNNFIKVNRQTTVCVKDLITFLLFK